MILDPRRIEEAAEIVTADDFYDERNVELFAAMIAMQRDRLAVDTCNLAAVLKRRGSWEAIGAAYIAEALHSVAVAAHVADHAARVAEFARRRRLRDAGFAAIADAHDLTADVAESINTAESRLAGIATGVGGDVPVTIADACAAALDRADEARNRKRSIGVPTGFPNFDHCLGGLYAGELVILAARPGVGKTSLACQIAANVARSGRGVYFASLEMDASELATRILCEASSIDSRIVRRGDTRDEEFAQLVEASNRIAHAALWIDQRPRLGVRDMLRAARRKHGAGLGLVVVDYLQRILPEDRRADRYQQIAEICKGLKTMARELAVPVLCLCQLGRAAEQTGRPELHHLRESGDIEAEADVVAFLKTNVVWPPERDSREDQAALIIGKNRNGPTPALRLRWEPKATRFSDPNSGQHEHSFDDFDGTSQQEDFQ